MKRAMSLEKIENGDSRKRFDDSSSDESKTSNVSKKKKSKNNSKVNSRNHTPRPSQVGLFWFVNYARCTCIVHTLAIAYAIAFYLLFKALYKRASFKKNVNQVTINQ